jgi:signal transduction histidine kinase
MGGDLRVRSRLGEGSVFTLMLADASDAAARTEAEGAVRP